MLLDGKNTSDSLISGTALIKKAKEISNINVKNVQEIFELNKDSNRWRSNKSKRIFLK